MVLRDMEKRAAKMCQTWNSGERIAAVPHPPDTLADGCHLFPCRGSRIFDHCASDELFLSPPSGLSHRFLARVDMIVLFFLEDKKQGIPIMTEHQLSLLPFYTGWGRYTQHLVAAIAPLTAEQLALRTTPQHWSIGMYVTHIVANRAWWFHARMGEGSDDLTSLYGLWESVRRTWIHSTRRQNWLPDLRRPGR
jgi:hypothetical protein